MAASDLRQVILTSHRNKRLRRSLPKRSDHFLDAQFIPKTPKSPPRPSEHKSCYAYLLCLFWSMAQITPLDTQIAPRTLKAFPRHSDYKSCYACLFISMVQITPQTLKSLPGRSNHAPDPQITSLAMLACLLACLFIS